MSASNAERHLPEVFRPLEIAGNDDVCDDGGDEAADESSRRPLSLGAVGVATAAAEPRPRDAQHRPSRGVSSAPPLRTSNPGLSLARRLLYVSRFCYLFSELAWGFGSAFWLTALSNYSSLFLVSAYHMTARVMMVVMVPFLSGFIDNAVGGAESGASRSKTNPKRWLGNRSSLMSFLIVGQHASVLLAILWIAGALGQQPHNGDACGQNNNDDDDNNADDSDYCGQGAVSSFDIVLISISGGLSKVFDNVLDVAIERDWIVVMAEEAGNGPPCDNEINNEIDNEIDNDNDEPSGEEHELRRPEAEHFGGASLTWLQETNVGLRQISLTCQMLGPVIMGYLLGFGTGAETNSILVILGFKALSMGVVWFCMRRLYWLLPVLQTHETGRSTRFSESSLPPVDRAGDGLFHDDDGDRREQRMPFSDFPEAAEMPAIRGEEEPLPPPLLVPANDAGDGTVHRAGWWSWSCCLPDLRIYCAQTMVWAGIGMSFLYANILTFGGMMTSYLVAEGGLSPASIGFYKALSNVAGLLGTLCFSRSRAFLDLESTGLCSILWMFACLSLSMVGVWVGSGAKDNDNESGLSVGSALVIAGVLPSRLGLWVYDICYVQLYQSGVPVSLRGRVGGTQSTLDSIFKFFPLLLGMVYSEVGQFWILMVMGYLSVGSCVLCYSLGFYLPHRYKKRATVASGGVTHGPLERATGYSSSSSSSSSSEGERDLPGAKYSMV